MPLHLLGKKSWNVYNPANIARVKRDEAESEARAEAEKKRLQDLEAERRLAILRGEVPPALPTPPSPPQTNSSSTHRKRGHDDGPTGQFRGGERRKRKRLGEDDTDFEMRVARERTDAASTSAVVRLHSTNKTSDAPLVDSRGHISLFPEDEKEREAPKNQKNEEVEREAAKKRRDFEDQYTMRFANAAGRDGVGVTGSGPWYASDGARDPRDLAEAQDTPGKDAWGNDDPKRKARDAARVVANDPLAMMKRGAAKVRDVERERSALNEEKARELKKLRKEEKRREKRSKRHHDVDELEGFSLDTQPAQGEEGNRKRGQREHRSRSFDRDGRDKHRHRHKSDHGDDRERRHHHHNVHGHESRSRRDNSREDREDRERHSSRQNRRRSARTDHY
ncbi:hypothetical protein FHL15_004537 [Xylaria flabelliformis]|uniref:CBF1-interacting co-repressor CIR N-terminal domain-containing protein n=1 Tax=Xylaria flabelliformis TaxID=2512241 RepID=A0A553I303_9PEZI|nr:hypothetical protein FHL15_004537 [Xylaria flabelliformis]